MRLSVGARRLLAVALVYLIPGCAALEQDASVARHATSIGARDSNVQRDGAAGDEHPTSSTGRKLRGKFLHISDIHPDPFYKTHSSTEQHGACHRGSGPAGFYGAETSACDSPLSLVNETFKWIDENIKDEIDFIVWTGDSARHDNDEKIPRTPKQIIEQNRMVVSKFVEVFGKDDNLDDPDPTNDFIIPIVPTFGNNDIMPHNIFMEGPNEWTISYLDIWRNFIPEDQRHQFQMGGWFFVEVIPNNLQIISLNAMYFFDSNSAVDGCSIKSEPGYEQMEWLRIHLRILRERGLKAILIGHVPPARTKNKMSWDETCWQKYTLWMQQYRDVVLASMWGHMNIDHFMLHDFNEVEEEFRKGIGKVYDELQSVDTEGDYVSIAGARDYLLDLRDKWAALPRPPKSKFLEDSEDSENEPWISFVPNAIQKILGNKSKKSGEGKKHKGGNNKEAESIGGHWGERYSMSIVGPSVIPNYFPTLRIIEYNITGLKDTSLPVQAKEGLEIPVETDEFKQSLAKAVQQFSSIDSAETREYPNKKEIRIQKEKSEKRVKKHKFKVPDPPSKSAPPGPAYSPQTLSLLGYSQLFANLTHINNDFTHDHNSSDDNLESEFELGPRKWKGGKHKDKRPGKKHDPHPNKFRFELEYSTLNDTIYDLKDMTVRHYIHLARRIGGSLTAVEGEYGVSPAEIYDGDDDDSVEAEKKTKKKKKHGRKRRKATRAWHAFVRRAFVGTIDLEDLDHLYGIEPETPGTLEFDGNQEL